MTRQKIALVGIGKIARDQHVPALEGSGDWELAATYSSNSTLDGIDSYTSMAALLEERDDIRTVSLCLPPVPRFDCAAMALRAGRHVMLEKPPGATVAECHALEALARENGVSLFTTWHSREAEQVDAARAWMKGKALRALRIIWKEDVRRWHPGQDWIFEAGGLGIFDPVINALSIATAILPEPLRVTGAELEFPSNRDTPIAGSIAFAHPGGAAVSAEMDFLKDGEQIWTIEIETDGGALTLSDGGATLTIDGKERSAADAGGAEDGSNPLLTGEYVRLYDRMARLVKAGESDVDLAPLVLAADAFMLGRRRTVEPFEW